MPFSARKMRTRRGLGAVLVCSIFMGVSAALPQSSTLVKERGLAVQGARRAWRPPSAASADNKRPLSANLGICREDFAVRAVEPAPHAQDLASAGRLARTTMQGGNDTIAPSPAARAKDPRAAIRRTCASCAPGFPQGTRLKPEFEYELLSMFVRNELRPASPSRCLPSSSRWPRCSGHRCCRPRRGCAMVISMKFFMIAAAAASWRSRAAR